MADNTQSNANVQPVTDAPYTPNVGDVANGVPADYVRKVNQRRSVTEHVVGNETTVDSQTHTDEDVAGAFDNRVMELVNGAIKDREERENKRANHRNANRFLTLLGAIIIGFIVVLLSQNGIIPTALAPYSFVITVLLDAAFVLYALIKHY